MMYSFLINYTNGSMIDNSDKGTPYSSYNFLPKLTFKTLQSDKDCDSILSNIIVILIRSILHSRMYSLVARKYNWYKPIYKGCTKTECITICIAKFDSNCFTKVDTKLYYQV